MNIVINYLLYFGYEYLTYLACFPYFEKYKKFWEELIVYFPLIRHTPHRKRRVQQLLYCCVCIRYRGNISTEPLSSSDKGIFTEPLPSNDKGVFTEQLPSNDKGIFTELLPSSDKGAFTEPLPGNDRGIHRHARTAT
jgi:hypothetical protein